VLGHAVGAALASISAETGRPVGFGLLTCETMEQARARTDKGAEAAEAAVEMANLRRLMENG
jgi:6,7-dimethyl-8-ribityllumazine synthase